MEGDDTKDTDSDGQPDYLDLDSDSDGIDDMTEGRQDADNDGQPNYIDTDRHTYVYMYIRTCNMYISLNRM